MFHYFKRTFGNRHAVRRAPGHDQLQLPARRLASGRAGLARHRARPQRHRHRRPQHAGRRRARLFGGQGISTRTPRIPEESWIKLLVGARLETRDGYSLLAYPMDRRRLQAAVAPADGGNRRAAKGECDLTFDDLARVCRGPARHRPAAAQDRGSGLPRASCASSPACIGDRCYLAGTMLFRGDDARRLAYLDNLAAQMKVRFVATNDVHYHVPERRALHDVVTAIRLKCTVEELGFRRFASAERHLKPPEEMAAAVPQASARDRAHPGDRRALPILARPAHLPVSGRVRGRRDADAEARAPDLEGRRRALSRRRSRQGRRRRSGTSST